MKQSWLKISVLLVLFISLSATALAETPESITGSLESIGTAFEQLFEADIGGFVANLLDAVPFFAIFLAVFGLFWWLGTITLFQNKEHKKFAVLVALGLTLGAVWEASIFEFFLRMNKLFFWIIIVSMFIFMVIMFWRHGRTGVAKKGSSMYDARRDQIGAKAGYVGEKQAFQKAAYGAESDLGVMKEKGKRTWRDLFKSKKNDKDLENTNRLAEKIDKNAETLEGKLSQQTSSLEKISSTMESLAKKMESLVNSSDPATQQTIVNELKHLGTLLHEGKDQTKHMIGEVNKLFSDFKKSLKDDKREAKDIHKELLEQMRILRESSDARLQQPAKNIERELQTMNQEIHDITQEDKTAEQEVEKEKSLLSSIDKDIETIAKRISSITKDTEKATIKEILNETINLKGKITRLKNLEGDVKTKTNQVLNLRKKLQEMAQKLENQEQKEITTDKRIAASEQKVKKDLERLLKDAQKKGASKQTLETESNRVAQDIANLKQLGFQVQHLYAEFNKIRTLINKLK